ncbi:MAG: peptide ABC transporter permease, partial [Bosea sp. (in: a-proteobacteria)]
ILFGRAGLALLLLVGWTVLSLVWSPYAPSASEKAGNLALAVALGLLGVSALPERTRASNLNLVPLGAGVAALFSLALLLGAQISPRLVAGAGDGNSLARGVSVFSVMVWPAIAWLLSRERNTSALVISVAAALVALAHVDDGGAVAIIIGAMVFGLVSIRPANGARLVAMLAAGAMLAAPLIPFVLKPFFSGPVGASLAVWGDIVLADPLRLITGYGLDTVLRGKISGVLPSNVPNTILFETWYELGLVGAASAALCLWFAIRAAGRMTGSLAPGGVAAYATAFALAALGFANLQTWWLMTLAAVAVLFTAIARGQYRTDRPIAPKVLRS